MMLLYVLVRLQGLVRALSYSERAKLKKTSWVGVLGVVPLCFKPHLLSDGRSPLPPSPPAQQSFPSPLPPPPAGFEGLLEHLCCVCKRVWLWRSVACCNN